MDREGDAYEVMMAVEDAGDSAIVPVDRKAGVPQRQAWVDVLDAGTNNKDEVEVRHALRPLARMCARTAITAILIRHWRKGSAPTHEKGMGSTAIGNASRAVLMVIPDTVIVLPVGAMP